MLDAGAGGCFDPAKNLNYLKKLFMGSPNIDLNIDQLILQGFSKRDAFYIGQAMRQELTRLIQESDLPPGFNANAHFARLNAGSITVAAGAKPEFVGRQIAASVYAGLGAGSSRRETVAKPSRGDKAS